MTQLPEHLIAGYRNFMAGRYADHKIRYRALAKTGQAPEVMVIGCCDSRAMPETIFDSAPGEIFTVRNVANLVPPYRPDGDYHGTSAALEFGVLGLKVKHIVVMGHGRCGGIKAALNPEAVPLSDGDFIGRWIDMLTPAIAALPEEGDPQVQQTEMERLSVKCTLENLRTFPYVKSLEDEERLSLHGIWFDISEGELWILDPERNDFHPLDV